jgi:hypothetical protein
MVERSNFHSLVSPLVHLIPTLWIKGPIHHTHMNEVKRLSPCPFFEYVVYFEDAIWGHPGRRGRKQIHSANRGCHASVSE